MRQSIIGLTCIVGLLFVQYAFAQTPTKLAPAIQECINSNAPMVEKAVPSLKDAVDFLVDSVCAAPISAEQARQSRAIMDQTAEQYRQECARTKSANASKTSSAHAGEEETDLCSLADSFSSSGVVNRWASFAPMQKDPDAESYAAKLLLDLRLSRTIQGAH
jgi:hypothetical protein